MHQKTRRSLITIKLWRGGVLPIPITGPIELLLSGLGALALQALPHYNPIWEMNAEVDAETTLRTTSAGGRGSRRPNGLKLRTFLPGARELIV